ADDSIRDRNVTGVQTCALPIFWKHFMGQGCGFLNVRLSVLRMLIFPLERCLLKEKVEKNDMCRLAGLPKGPCKLILITDEMFCKTRQMIMRLLMHCF